MLYLARLVRYPGRVLADLSDHSRGVGFFTIVAGDVRPGHQFVLIVGDAGRCAFGALARRRSSSGWS